MGYINQYTIMLDHAICAAFEAGKEILKVKNGNMNARQKEDKSYVTDADMNANRVIMNQ